MKTTLPTTRNSKEGFTLIELLIAITIVAILSVIAYSIFSNIQKGSRDSVRRIEIDSLAKNIESSFDPALRTYTYTQLMYQTDFNNNFPRDPLQAATDLQAYCVAIGTTSNAPTTAITYGAWGASTTAPCAGGGIPFNNKSHSPATINLTPIGTTNTVNTTDGTCSGTNICTVVAAAPSWYLCAKLEATPSLYCRASLQSN